MSHAPLQDCCFGFFYKLSITVSSHSPQLSQPAALQKQVRVQPLQILSRKAQRHRGAAASGDAQTMSLGHRGSRLDARVAASRENQICCCFWQTASCSPGRGELAVPSPRHPGSSAAAPAALPTGERGTGHAAHEPGAGAASRKHCCGQCEQHSCCMLQRYFLGRVGAGIPGERRKAAPGPAGSTFSRPAERRAAQAARPCGRADPAAGTGDPRRAPASPGTPHPPPATGLPQRPPPRVPRPAFPPRPRRAAQAASPSPSPPHRRTRRSPGPGGGLAPGPEALALNAQLPQPRPPHSGGGCASSRPALPQGLSPLPQPLCREGAVKRKTDAKPNKNNTTVPVVFEQVKPKKAGCGEGGAQPGTMARVASPWSPGAAPAQRRL